MTPEYSKQRMEIAMEAMNAMIPLFSYRSATYSETLFYDNQIACNAFRLADEMLSVSRLEREEIQPIKEIHINKDAFEKAIISYKEKNGSERTPPSHQILDIIELYLKNNKA